MDGMCGGSFSRHDRRVTEVDPKSGTIDLQFLLLRMTLVNSVRSCRIERYSSVSGTPSIISIGWDMMFSARPMIRSSISWLDVTLYQPLVTLAQISREIVGAVPVDLYIREFDLIEDGANGIRAQRRMVEESDKLIEGPFEVDVVFP